MSDLGHHGIDHGLHHGPHSYYRQIVPSQAEGAEEKLSAVATAEVILHLDVAKVVEAAWEASEVGVPSVAGPHLEVEVGDDDARRRVDHWPELAGVAVAGYEVPPVE